MGAVEGGQLPTQFVDGNFWPSPESSISSVTRFHPRCDLQNVLPDPTTSCGPYSPNEVQGEGKQVDGTPFGGKGNHDTIGIAWYRHHRGETVVLGMNCCRYGGYRLRRENGGGDFHQRERLQDSGARYSIPDVTAEGKNSLTTRADHVSFRRVGDSPIPGSGSYVDSRVGGAAATGDGDIMLRFLPAFVAVEGMRAGLPPQLAAQEAMDRITTHYQEFSGAVVALSNDGTYGAACWGLADFPFSVRTEGLNESVVVKAPCVSSS